MTTAKATDYVYCEAEGFEGYYRLVVDPVMFDGHLRFIVDIIDRKPDRYGNVSLRTTLIAEKCRLVSPTEVLIYANQP